MEKNMDIILSVLQPLVANKIISPEELEQIKNLSCKDNNSNARLDSYKTIDETSEILHVDRKTIYNWIKQGKLTYSRISSKKVLIYESSIVQFIESNKNRAPDFKPCRSRETVRSQKQSTPRCDEVKQPERTASFKRRIRRRGASSKK